MTESNATGWSLESISCQGSKSNSVSVINRKVAINLQSGENITCTFVNKLDKGSLTITKQALGDDDEYFEFDTNFDTSSSHDTQNSFWLRDDQSRSFDLPVGNYAVDEDSESGWKLTGLSCSDGSSTDLNSRLANISLSKDEHVTCTFTNTQLGTIKGQKFEDKDADGNRDWSEKGLSGWLIFIDKNGNSNLDDGEQSQVTSNNHWSYGWYEFDQLLPGSYRVCEEMKSEDWHNATPVCQTTTITPGDTDTIYFGNYKNANVTIKKDVVDAGGRPTYDDSTSFEFDLSREESTFTLSDEETRTFNLKPGNYTLDEINRSDNYEFAGCYVVHHEYDHDHDWDDEHEGDDRSRSRDHSDYRFSVKSGEEITIVCKNKQRTGDLEVTKYNDVNGNGVFDKDEEPLSGWNITLGQYESNRSDLTDEETGKAYFNDLLTGWYNLGETMQSGWTQTSISCQEREDGQESKHIGNVFVAAGQTTTCEIGNQKKPVLRIQKSNDATGAKNPGDIVTYKLVINLADSDLNDVEVTDVTPDGFTYILGTWTASKNGSPFTIDEPQYGSPATWFLKGMAAGDEVVLTYQAKISSDQDGGIYNDSAWAQGNSAGWDESPILAIGHDSEYLDEGIFVGTDVEVNKSYQQDGSADIEREITGDVLGASTELPATGADTGWLLLALGTLITGLFLIFGGKRMQKLTLGALLLLTPFTYNLVPSVHAADPSNNLSVRIEQPSTPTRSNDWKLSYSVLSRAGGFPVVSCYVKKPGSSSFVGFGATHTSIKATGDNGNCKVDSSVMSDQGSYEFYVTASAGSDSEESSRVTVNYDTSGPGTPNYFSKEHSSMCHWVIKFHTADDAGATTKVEIYSSDKKNFDTNSGSRVGTVNIGSNQDGTFTHDRADNCDREWYYVIRAYDAAGNQSDTRGDEIVTTTSSTTTSPSVTPALVVATSNGSVLGKTDVVEESTLSGEVLGEEKKLESEMVDAQGLLATATAAVEKTAKNKTFWWIISTIIALRIVYGITRKKTSY